MKTLKRSISPLLFLALLSFAPTRAEAEDLVVENGKIVLPSTVIRGQYESVLSLQKHAKAKFLAEVEYSPFEVIVEDVSATVTADGFVLDIVPKFSTQRKTKHNPIRTLAFVRGDPEMVLLAVRGPEAFKSVILHQNEEVRESQVFSATLNGRKVTVLVVVKIGLPTIST